MTRALLALLVLPLALAGCTPDLVYLTEHLERRNVSACIRLFGQYASLGAEIKMTTGTATMADCGWIH